MIYSIFILLSKKKRFNIYSESSLYITLISELVVLYEYKTLNRHDG